MKKGIYFWLAVLATALIFGFLGWAFSQHGTIGLYRVNGFYRMVFTGVGAFGIALLGLAVFERWLHVKRPARSTNILTFFVRVFTLAGIIIPLVAFAYVGVNPGPFVAGESPQLLITEGNSLNGVPDIAIVFNTEEPTSNIVYWGTDSSSKVLSDEKSVKQHVFMLSDLQPDTAYWYQVNDGAKYYFTTPPINGQSMRFAVFSDAHFGDATRRSDLSDKMLQYIADPANNFRLLFSSGDLVEYGFKDSHWQEALQSISSVTSVIPIKYALGNHETILGGLKRYEAYCSPAGMPLQDGTRLYQRIDVGKVHFLVIDLEWSAECYTSAQDAWLEKQLASIPQDDWTIVMGHGFYYASGSYDNGWQWYDNPETISKLTPLFEKYGVDIVFSGHAHQLELLRKNGVTYAICGAFAAEHDSERQYVSPASVWYSAKDYAFVDVKIDDSTAELIFRAPDYKELSSFVIQKH
ncbi:MAG: metallophosphoesterase family protein [Dehalococcoidales bacterium]|nr:metallophosphoesterase family protein [Dehalococcoidales bacterium]